MHKLNQKGSLVAPLIAVVILLVVAVGFASWAFAGRQDYKNNSEAKTAQAVKLAVRAEAARKDAQFAEAEKSPTKTYVGPDTYGSVKFRYPKTWSAYIVENNSSSGSSVIDGYFHPDFVPDVDDIENSFAFRLQIADRPYDQELADFESSTTAGTARVIAYRAAKVPKVLGSRVIGEDPAGKQVNMVLIPLRDKTLKLWTESDDYLDDFNKLILPKLTFVP